MKKQNSYSGSLNPEFLVRAYKSGIFPMAEARDDPHIHWIDPEMRGIIPLDAFHVSKSLKKTLRRGIFEVRADTAFEPVIRACAAAGRGRRETWINDVIIDAFIGLHELGLAHSIESWRDEKLQGGLYGLALGGAFCGESMFSEARDASKVALVHLVARLRFGGFTLLDTQFVTEHLKRFGAVEIRARDYLGRLDAATGLQACFHSAPGTPPGLAEELEKLWS
ncbi:MAG TPA: leucyl/phenylalanyl-tRNA--protein transferase [Alphaproteobacteria bacterium]|nr:leucyl/phenylalanyl-tRNA--protein transferase [Alphaproteobacteria bacterium]